MHVLSHPFGQLHFEANCGKSQFGASELLLLSVQICLMCFYLQSVLGHIGHQVSEKIVSVTSDIMFCNQVGEQMLVLCEVYLDFFSEPWGGVTNDVFH